MGVGAYSAFKADANARKRRHGKTLRVRNHSVFSNITDVDMLDQLLSGHVAYLSWLVLGKLGWELSWLLVWGTTKNAKFHHARAERA